MPMLRAVLVLAVLSSAAFAQETPVAAPQPGAAANLQVFSQAVAQQRRGTQLQGEALAQVDQLLTEATQLNTAGNGSEARRKLAQASTLLAGEEWNAKQEFLWSLTLRADKIIADSRLPLSAKLEQVYGAQPPGDLVRLRLNVKLAPAAPLPNIQPVTDQPEPPPANANSPPRDAGVVLVFSSDLIAQPAPVVAVANDVANGPWKITAELLAGDNAQPLATLSTDPVLAVAGIESLAPGVQSRLAKISGHDGTKASVNYPFDLARVVNQGIRPWESFYFPAPYDFAAGLQRSEELLAALEAGNDPLWRAKGDVKKHYWFADAGEIMPYRMHVPAGWDGTSKLPMVLVLHGNTKDQDYYLDRDGGALRNLAEQHGYVVVTPYGYHPNGGWRAPDQGAAAGGRRGGGGIGRGGRGGRGGGGRGGNDAGFAGFRGGQDSRRGRFGALSEQDAVNVLDLVMAEYPIDESRVYLFGHSSGGAGSYHLAQKYAERWAGVGVSSGNVNPQTYPFDRIRDMPFIIVHGSLDNEVRPEQSRNFSAALKEQNIAHEFIEFPEATHATIVATGLPKVFDYFNTHNRHQPK